MPCIVRKAVTSPVQWSLKNFDKPWRLKFEKLWRALSTEQAVTSPRLATDVWKAVTNPVDWTLRSRDEPWRLTFEKLWRALSTEVWETLTSPGDWFFLKTLTSPVYWNLSSYDEPWRLTFEKLWKAVTRSTRRAILRFASAILHVYSINLQYTCNIRTWCNIRVTSYIACI